MTRRKYDIQALAGELYDTLANCPQVCEHGIRGLTKSDIAKDLSVPGHIVSMVIRAQRLIFGDDDEINIPYHVCGKQRIYHLSASIEAGERWQLIRMRNEIAQIQVTRAWWQSLSRAHAEETFAGRMARMNDLAYAEIEGRVRLLMGELPEL
jgi:hypothetical protein